MPFAWFLLANLGIFYAFGLFDVEHMEVAQKGNLLVLTRFLVFDVQKLPENNYLGFLASAEVLRRNAVASSSAVCARSNPNRGENLLNSFSFV
jgi:hypothetical protein